MTLTKILFLVLFLLSVMTFFSIKLNPTNPQVLSVEKKPQEYWLQLDRKSKKELLFEGIPGDQEHSTLMKEFQVNVGIPNKRPTPLPSLLGRNYWNIIAKTDVKDDPETAPYFLTLDIPFTEDYPFGPTPYNECDGKQCDWVRPGSFGLHGIADTASKLTDEGSSGCIRHKDEDITYLYNLLDPSTDTPVRYYIRDL